MVTFSFVQGRLSSKVAGRYQYFPIHNWRNEFKEGKKIGFNGIEWIISDFSNPIFDPNSQNEIFSLCRKYQIKISSISLDLLMHKTLDKYSNEELFWIFKAIKKISKNIKLERISIPIEESCGIRDPKTFKKVQKKLISIVDAKIINKKFIAIESDMTPHSLEIFLSPKKLSGVGVLLDVGNAAAYGYKIRDYVNILGNKIYSLHIKDRPSGLGLSVPLGEGAAEFDYLFSNLHKLKKLRDIVLQTYKSEKNYFNDLTKAKKFISNLLSS